VVAQDVGESDVELAQEPPKKVKVTTEERVRSGEENRLLWSIWNGELAPARSVPSNRPEIENAISWMGHRL
jgi:hypothetical protein